MKLEKLRLKKGGEMLSKNKQIFIVDDDVSVCRALSVLLVCNFSQEWTRRACF
jgi:hypothetical protein